MIHITLGAYHVILNLPVAITYTFLILLFISIFSEI